MKTHLVSQVLLRRFTTNNKLKVYSLESHETLVKSPREIGYIDTSDEVFSKSEERWKRVETRTATAFISLDSGNLLSSPQHITTIKDLMILHFVRSLSFFSVIASKQPVYFERMVQLAKSTHPNDAAYIELNRKFLYEHWIRTFYSKVPLLIKTITEKITRYVYKHDIEIGMCEEEVVILGDNPAINMSKDGRYGILEQVPINESVGFLLPLGPKHIVALTSQNMSKEYKYLSVNDVRSINTKTIKQCLGEYYSK